jgi:hypothetical protein
MANGGTNSASISSGYVKSNGTTLSSQTTPIPIGDGGTGATSISSGYVKSNGSVLSNQATPIPIADGGTNATVANTALNNLLPTQTSNSGKFLQTDGSNTSWVTTPFTPTFTSSDQTVTFSSTLNVAHGLGQKPSLVMVTFKNATAELNYSVGDEIPFTGPSTGAATVSGPTAVFDTTNVTIVLQGSVRVPNKTTQTDSAITATNWKIVVRAWK